LLQSRSRSMNFVPLSSAIHKSAGHTHYSADTVTGRSEPPDPSGPLELQNTPVDRWAVTRPVDDAEIKAESAVDGNNTGRSEAGGEKTESADKAPPEIDTPAILSLETEAAALLAKKREEDR